MHQTTVRFGPDLWEALEEECSELGVSVAQFVREAALTRLVYLAGRRGEPDYERALELSGARMPETSAPPGTSAPSELEALADTLDGGGGEMSDSAARWARGRDAQRRERRARDDAGRRRPEP
jgi:hypothetical protein